MTAINPPGTTADVAFTLDALGRYATRAVNGVTDTYGYQDSSETVVAIVGATTRVSAIGADGSRVATKDGTTTAYLLPDLHGNVIAAQQSGSTAIANAIRYDGYGQSLGTPYTATGAVAMDAKYQGRLDLSATTDPLYDMSARFYAPGSGTFTQLDSVMGSAQNPLSMNRFLYAEANPTTLIDPTGHRPCEYDCEESAPTPAETKHSHQVAIETAEKQNTKNGGGTSTNSGGAKSPDPQVTVIPYTELPTWTKNCYHGWCTWSQSMPTDWSEVALMGCSIIPIAGTGCDAEDLRRNAERGDVVGVALAGVGFVWGLGDVVKFAGKSANLVVDTVVRNLSGSDELAIATLRTLARGASVPPTFIRRGVKTEEWAQAKAWGNIRGGEIIGVPKTQADAADIMHNGVAVSLKKLEGTDGTFISQILEGSDDLSGLTKGREPRVNRVGAEGWITAQTRTTQQVLDLIDQPFRLRSNRTIASTVGGQGYSALLFLTSDGLVVITR